MIKTPQEWGEYWGPICFPPYKRTYNPETDTIRETGFTDEEIERALRMPYKPTLMRRDADGTLVA